MTIELPLGAKAQQILPRTSKPARMQTRSPCKQSCHAEAEYSKKYGEVLFNKMGVGRKREEGSEEETMVKAIPFTGVCIINKKLSLETLAQPVDKVLSVA